MRLRTFLVLAIVVPTGSLMAVEPATEPPPGAKMLDAYFRRQVRKIADDCLKDVTSREDWERQRPELRRQFLDMVGLWPLPPRSDLKATVTGTLDAGAFTIEKLHFQSRPGLYVTGNLYVPKNARALPAVLYVCGHANVVRDGVSFGNKVSYQHHPTWFAQNGYVCLVVDTLQLGEVPGIHHGTYRFGEWWWQALSYSPAGVECWNAMRALDYLESRPEVDPKRMGVTGRSGGGATSWWLAAADDRVQCIVPVAGIADLYAHLIEGEAEQFRRGGVIAGHCDCMYMVNCYRWDFPLVAALCAPRPLLLGNSDVDAIFPVGGFRRMEAKVRRIYDLYGAGEKFAVLETAGPHKDTPELRLGAFRWLNRWLKNDTGPVIEHVREPFTPDQLRVFEKLPDDSVNNKIQHQFVTRQSNEPPVDKDAVPAWWTKRSTELREVLRTRVFHGWPQEPPDLNARVAVDMTHGGLRLRAYDFVSEEGIDLRLWVTTAASVDKPSVVILAPVDEAGFTEWLREFGPDFAKAFPTIKMPPRDGARFTQTAKTLAFHKWAFATFAPRGVGPTRWAAPGSRDDIQVRRRFALIGQTLDGQRVWDVRRAANVLKRRDEWKDVPLWLQGKGEMAGLALHAALFEPEIKRIDLWDLPQSYSKPPTFLNVWRFFDVPEAIALALPRDLRLYVSTQADADAWETALRLARTVDKDAVKIRVTGD